MWLTIKSSELQMAFAIYYVTTLNECGVVPHDQFHV